MSHFYVLCLPPMFVVWRTVFGVSFAELGLTVAMMSGTTAILQAPVGFLVDRYGARSFLVGGTLLMSLSIAAMGLATNFWQILALATLSGMGNSVIHPVDYAIISGSVDKDRMGRSRACGAGSRTGRSDLAAERALLLQRTGIGATGGCRPGAEQGLGPAG